MIAFLAILSGVLLFGCLFLLYCVGKLATEKEEVEATLAEANKSNEALIGLVERANVRYHDAQAALQQLGFASISGNEDVN